MVALASAGRLARSEADAALSALAARVLDGDSAAAETLLAVVYELSFVRGTIGRVLFDPHDAEDAMQETMLSLTRSLHSFEAGRSFVTWACVIAHNKAVDVIRRRRSTPMDLDRRDELFEAHRFSSQLASVVDLEQVLAALSPKLAEVVRLRDVQHLSYEEIAAVADIKINTVRSRLSRGRAQAQLLIEAAS